MEAPPERPKNNGMTDGIEGPATSQYLLFRPLETAITEELLAKGATKLLRPAYDDDNKKPQMSSTTTAASAGARPDSILRTFLARDRETGVSMKFGFVEFTGIADAKAALARFHTLDRLTISSKAVMVSPIHAGVFLPPLEATEPKFSFPAYHNPSQQLTYWDPSIYLSLFYVAAEPVETVSAEDPPAPESTKSRKRKAENKELISNVKRPPVSHLVTWTNRHKELRGIKDARIDAGPTESMQDSTSVPAVESFVNRSKNCCYLCSRQFKDTIEVNRHERLSDLHKQNLQKDELVRKARARLKAVDGPPQQLTQDQRDEYRDRARDRRATQYDKQLPREQRRATPATVAPEAKISKGAKMLAKMSGLEQPLVVDEAHSGPIPINTYAAGVGLGAEGGIIGDAVEVANRATRNDYKDWVDSVKEKTKARFLQE